MAKLTKRFIESIKPPESDYKLEWDDELKGFGVKITQSRIITFVVFYRNKRRQQRRIAIGHYGVMSSPDEARTQALMLLGKVAGGEDPAEERKHERGESTFSALATEYIKRHASQKKSGQEDIRIIKRDLLKPWGNLPAKEIRRRDVIRLIDGIMGRNSPVMSNRTLSLIKRVYNFGISRDLVDSNPTVLVKPPGKETRRERALRNDEIKQLWENLDGMQEAGALVIAALRLVLVLGQRSGEVLNMEWSEIDFETATWELPSAKVKNAQAHQVPLASMALRILSSLPKQGGYVFPSRTGASIDESRPMKTHALSSAVRRNRELLGLEQFCPHDLRRTCASGLASIGVERFIISRILNHTVTGQEAGR